MQLMYIAIDVSHTPPAAFPAPRDFVVKCAMRRSASLSNSIVNATSTNDSSVNSGSRAGSMSFTCGPADDFLARAGAVARVAFGTFASDFVLPRVAIDPSPPHWKFTLGRAHRGAGSVKPR